MPFRLLASRLIRVLSVLASVLACSAGIAADGPFWPRFHGPKGDNISTDTGLLKSWPEDGPKLLWQANKIGAGYATVSLADGLIHTAGDVDDKTIITALDLNGKIAWQVANGPAWTKDYPGTRGTPTIDGPRLYHQNPLGDVVCLEAKTGKQLWTVNILTKFNASNIKWALAESVVVDGDRVICCPGGPDTAVVALNKLTGETVWKSPSTGDATAYATPAVVVQDGLRMVLTLTAKAIIAVNADTGDLLWRHEHITNYDVNVMTPILHAGQVFVSTGYRSGSVALKMTVSGQKAAVEKVWESKDMDNHHGGVMLVDGYLYGTTQNLNPDKLVCLNWKTGEKQWAEKAVGKGSLTYADGLFYCVNEKSSVGLVKATPEKMELISRFRLPEGGEGPSWAHPVVCGGRLYIRHGDYLFAFDVKAK